MALDCWFSRTNRPFKKEAKCQEQTAITFQGMFGTSPIVAIALSPMWTLQKRSLESRREVATLLNLMAVMYFGNRGCLINPFCGRKMNEGHRMTIIKRYCRMSATRLSYPAKYYAPSRSVFCAFCLVVWRGLLISAAGVSGFDRLS